MSEIATNRAAVRPGQSKLRRNPRPSPRTETAFWEPVNHGWQVLYGGMKEMGVSIEWHDFELARDFDWSRHFHPDSLELCLNVAGHGSVRTEKTVVDFKPLTAGFYWQGKPTLQAERRSGEQHRFITIEFSVHFLRERLAGCDGALHPLVEGFVQGDLRSGGISQLHRLTTEQERWVAHLLRPPSFRAARSLWYQSKVLQLMVDFFFQRQDADELFCDRQRRTTRDRAERVAAFLHRRLAEPPSLEEIGREVGCSPFYLSRIFSHEMGTTIPQFLRKIRMERAAALLRSGKYNVTEAAMEVGYSSLSHFSQAFCQAMGCCPALYPRAKLSPTELAVG